tara:strand:- start:497 stop:706 length:210 start_codon:yes stop_codon:yes gene_type:complete
MDFTEQNINQLYDTLTSQQVKLMNDFKQNLTQEHDKDLDQQIKLLAGLSSQLIKYRNHLRKMETNKNAD